jgi:hypothetical protein
VTAVSASKRRAMVGAQREVVAIADEDQAMQASLPFLLQVVGEYLLGVELAVRLRLRSDDPDPRQNRDADSWCVIAQVAALGSVNLLKCRRMKTKCCLLFERHNEGAVECPTLMHRGCAVCVGRCSTV